MRGTEKNYEEAREESMKDENMFLIFVESQSISGHHALWYSANNKRINLEKEIIGIEYKSKYSVLKLINGNCIDIDKSLKKWAEELREYGFISLRSNYLANVRHIKSFFSREKGRWFVLMTDNSEIAIPKGKYRNTRNNFEEIKSS